MATATVNIKGLVVVADYDYFRADPETGFGDDTTINTVHVLGNDAIVDDDEDKNIVDVLSNDALELVAEGCRINAIESIRQGVEPC